MTKYALMILGAGLLAFSSSAEDKKAETKSEPPRAQKIAVNKPDDAPKKQEDEKDMRQKVSYAAGMHFGNQLKRSDYDFDMEEVAKAMKDVLSGGATKMNESQAQATIQKWQTEQQGKREAKRKQEAIENKKKGDAFLAENAKKSGVKKTASGLQYEVITAGTGKTPGSNDTVKVHYTGTLLDGTEFDSSRKKGQPAEFMVTGVIKGWTEALQMMKTGSRWKLYIPAELAYGEFGRPNIPPNSVLIFDVELLEVKEPIQPAKAEDSVQAVSGEIIKVPSAEELKKGAKIEVLKEEDVKKMLATNAPGSKAASTNKPAEKPKQ